jgi:small-conductance mechanosensitive channel
MLSNNTIVVPNAALAKAIVINYSLPETETAVSVRVTVDFDSDLERVERAALEVARQVLREVPGAAPAVEPSIRFQTFGDVGITATVGLRGREFADQPLLVHELVKRLQARFKQEGIAIASPIRPLTGSRASHPV